MTNEQSERAMLRNRISAHSFAAWELHLFLDTHPENVDALRKQQEHSAEANVLIAEYQKKYGPIRTNQNDTDRWTWVNDPWPWQTEGNE